MKSVGTRWLLVGSLGFLGVAAAGALFALRGEPVPPERIGEPDYYLWAWRREEDLSFIDPNRVKVALWTATITLRGDELDVAYRVSKATYPTAADVVAVVRLEAAGTPNRATVGRLADAIIAVNRPFRPVEHQVDFDARLSQRAFYRRLLEALQERIGSARLSITALASWCGHDDWTAGLPVDAVVPMIYRMGREGEAIRHMLHTVRAFPNPICAGSVGYSADEPLAPVDGLQRVFLFHPQPWSKHRFQDLARRVEALR